MTKCCENCIHWTRDIDPPTTGLCEFPEPPVPFYMEVESGLGPRTCADNGSQCQVFEQREERKPDKADYSCNNLMCQLSGMHTAVCLRAHDDGLTVQGQIGKVNL